MPTFVMKVRLPKFGVHRENVVADSMYAAADQVEQTAETTGEEDREEKEQE